MPPAARRLPILMYHRVGLPPPESTCRGLFTSTRAFEGHLRLLSRLGYRSVDFDDLAAAIDEGAPLPDKPVMLTFDDGHADNLGVLPLLRRYDARASIFVLAGEMGGHRVVWSEASERAPTDLLSWDQAREIRDGGGRIESHGLTHRHLDRLEPGIVEQQLRLSRERIAEELGRAPLAHAYPYGTSTQAVQDAARRAGFRFACLADGGTNDVGALDCWRLCRVPVRGYRWIHRLRFTVAALRGFA